MIYYKKLSPLRLTEDSFGYLAGVGLIDIFAVGLSFNINSSAYGIMGNE